MTKTAKNININSSIRYKEEYDLYTFRMCHKRNWWWLLLLLLPLLLFVKCSKDITVTCIDSEGNFPVAGQEVKLDYTAHFLYNDGKFLADEPISIVQETDSTGCTTFEDLPCSVFSYIFYCLQQADYSVGSECYGQADEKHNFHYVWNVEIELEPFRTDLYIKLMDKETLDVLPDAKVVYRYIDNGEEKTDSAEADAAGIAVIPQMRYCSVIDKITGSCYGYMDEVRMDIPNQKLAEVSDSTALLLTPIMERFDFFVKNKISKQPIPEALCDVSLTHPGLSRTVTTRRVTTSIDGKGVAVYDSAFVLSVINIQASKVNYYDGELEGGPWVVEEFIKQDEDTRTVWLTPKPYVQEFVNIDSINGEPIPGVENVIRIISPDGTTSTITEISNRNGVFPISATEDDRIEIVSTKNNEYIPKKTIVPLFKEAEKEIRMQPEMGTVVFRTVVDGTGRVLPGCQLKITGSISGNIPPTNSGNGVFEVNMRKAENISIVASKSGYAPNTTKVRNARYHELAKSPQARRDIPLIPVPPCGGGSIVSKGASGRNHQATYGMGQLVGNTTIDVDFYSEPDMLTVYDGPKAQGTPIINKRIIQNKMVIPIHFTQGAVTVVITSSDSSSWEYVVNCP